MAKWDSEQYLKFKAQRTQPAKDLLARISGRSVKKCVDIGSGPGNSTAEIKKIFPNADILGIDSSPDMIKKAREQYPDLRFELCDARETPDSYDLIFSNACLQWVPNHGELLPCLCRHLEPGGVLAVQIPRNGDEPLFKIIDEVVAEDKWGFPDSAQREFNATLTPEEYFDILSGCSSKFDIWETVYYHNMPSVESLVEWVKGTRLLPYLNVLSEKKAEEFLSEITERAKRIYGKRENGEVIFKFRRLFFTAEREG